MKSKVFVFIIIGLGLALAVALWRFSTMILRKTLTNSMITTMNSIKYRCLEIRMELMCLMVSSSVLGNVIKDEIPSIERVSKFERAGTTIKKDNNIFNRTIAFVDKDFMDMFTFKMLHGNANGYHELSTVLISDRVATALFGRVDAVGETVELVRTSKENIFLTVVYSKNLVSKVLSNFS